MTEAENGEVQHSGNFDWAAAIADVDMDPNYQVGSESYERVVGNILDERAAISRKMIGLNNQFRELMSSIQPQLENAYEKKDQESLKTLPEYQAMLALQKEMWELHEQDDQLLREMMRISEEK